MGMTTAKLKTATGNVRADRVSGGVYSWTSDFGGLIVSVEKGKVASVVMELGTKLTTKNPYLKLKTSKGIGMRSLQTAAQAKYPGGVLLDHSRPGHRVDKVYLVPYGSARSDGLILATFFAARQGPGQRAAHGDRDLALSQGHVSGQVTVRGGV